MNGDREPVAGRSSRGAPTKITNITTNGKTDDTRHRRTVYAFTEAVSSRGARAASKGRGPDAAAKKKPKKKPAAARGARVAALACPRSSSASST